MGMLVFGTNETLPNNLNTDSLFEHHSSSVIQLLK
ncbi:MAG: hypothetical protein UT36_C0007G0007 [Candidatus Peregrinibacteria bacterium GW2011_GWF2_39_17]|nr:MAG: hypothetical protein UT36_C0007G0007 [Candidatus Peregrinibacteria bacterium GW2011_GWF2_39_17]